METIHDEYSFLTHHARILLSHSGVGYLYPPPLSNALVGILSYPMTKEVLLNKLHQTTIILRTIDGTIRFNNAKVQIHPLDSICVLRGGI